MAYTLYKTNYFDKFCCIADKCKNNCCHDWGINLSKSDYNCIRGYKFSPELKEKINSSVKRIKPFVNDRFYASIKLEDNGKCPFNNDDGLCEIHLDTGRGDMIYTCSSYPRVTNIIYHVSSYFPQQLPHTIPYPQETNMVFNVGAEKCCHTSCEAVVKLLTEMPEGIKILCEDIKQSEYQEITHSSKAVNKKHIEKRPILNYYTDIKNTCLNLLQNRKMQLDERVLHLGFFLQKLSEAEKNSKFSNISDIIEEFEGQTENERVKEYLCSIKGRKNYMFMSNCGMIMCMFKKNDFLNAVVSNLEIKTGNNGQFLLNEEKYENYSRSFMDIQNMKGFILENIAVNIFIEMMFPFSQINLDIWNNYCLFCRYYNLLKFCVSAYLAGRQDTDSLIQAVAKFSREVLHSGENIESIFKELNVLKLSDPGDTAVLIRT